MHTGGLNGPEVPPPLAFTTYPTKRRTRKAAARIIVTRRYHKHGEPAAANVNVDTVVLACEEGWDTRAAPQAAITIDRRTWPVALLFADDYVVLADTEHGPFPALSDQLLAAMQAGTQMTLHFDLLDEWPGQPASFDSEAVIDLQAPGGREAIAAMRRCVDPPSPCRQLHRSNAGEHDGVVDGAAPRDGERRAALGLGVDALPLDVKAMVIQRVATFSNFKRRQ